MNQAVDKKSGKKLRGVNLGGWLVLEKWMTPSLFEGLQARDETSYCVELGAKAAQTLKNHWNTFITREDFAWLAHTGINAVRIPIGHWIFGPDYPYHQAYGESAHPFVEGGIAILDRAFDWAEEYGLEIVLDLHAAPGCQNGFSNGGIRGVCEWHTKPEYLNYALLTLERLAQRYHNRPVLHAIAVLNEPSPTIDTALLKKYITDGYHRIRQYCQAKDVIVLFDEGFRSFREYTGFLTEPEFSNGVLDIHRYQQHKQVEQQQMELSSGVLDIHRYQCFGRAQIDADIYGYIRCAVVDWKREADEIITDLGHSVYVGEWSLGMASRAESFWAKGPSNQEIDEFKRTVAYRAYAAAQLLTFEKYPGWFFWSYKTETKPDWSFRDCVNRGWLPDKFDG